MQLAQGDAAAALESYRKALAIIQRAADVDPSNATWQRDVAISYGKLAAALGKAGETEQALDALRRGKAVVERMAELFPDNAGVETRHGLVPGTHRRAHPGTPK